MCGDISEENFYFLQICANPMFGLEILHGKFMTKSHDFEVLGEKLELGLFFLRKMFALPSTLHHTQ